MPRQLAEPHKRDADRRSKSKRIVRKGDGDRGDQKRS